MRCSRDESYLYPIQPHQFGSGQVGRTADGRQVIMDFYDPHIAAVFFDGEGNLLQVEHRPMPSKESVIECGFNVYAEEIEPLFLPWQREMGFHPITARVKRFFVLGGDTDQDRKAWQREGIGIQDYPGHWLEVLEDPVGFAPDERECVNRELLQWQREGWFVFWWGNDYWLNGSGECVAT